MFFMKIIHILYKNKFLIGNFLTVTRVMPKESTQTGIKNLQANAELNHPHHNQVNAAYSDAISSATLEIFTTVMSVSLSGLQRWVLQYAKSSWSGRIQPNPGLLNANMSLSEWTTSSNKLKQKNPTRTPSQSLKESWAEWKRLKISQKLWERMPGETRACSLKQSLIQQTVIKCRQQARSNHMDIHVCISPEFLCWSPDPQLVVFGDGGL